MLSTFLCLALFFLARDVAEAVHDKAVIEGGNWHTADLVLWAFIFGAVGWLMVLAWWGVVAIVVAGGLFRASSFSVILNRLRGKPWAHLGQGWVDKLLAMAGTTGSLVVRGVLYLAGLGVLWYVAQ